MSVESSLGRDEARRLAARDVPARSLPPRLRVMEVAGEVAARLPVDPLVAGPVRDILDTLGIAVYTTDADGAIRYFNRSAAAFWGRRPEPGERYCGSWRLFFPDGTPMRHDQCPLAVCLRGGEVSLARSAMLERPDGTRIAFDAYPNPLRDLSGAIVGAVNVLVDVTERLRAEEELRHTARALRASNQVKDEFLGLVSHELRTPVTTIFGNAQLLRERAERLPEADRQAMIVDIADDSERLLDIVENLLLLTRLEAGWESELEPQVLRRIVAKAIEGFRHRHPERPIHYHADMRRLVIVDADRTQIGLVMENLLSNADKYSPQGEPIDVRVRVRDDEIQAVVLDRGIGLGPDDVPRLFTPFFRADAARRVSGGVGIGLAVCKRIIELHGGRIWAEPREGGGAEIGFSLPVGPDAAILRDVAEPA